MYNILFDDDGKLWIVDWKCAGFYPTWFESLAMRIAARYEPKSRGRAINYRTLSWNNTMDDKNWSSLYKPILMQWPPNTYSLAACDKFILRRLPFSELTPYVNSSNRAQFLTAGYCTNYKTGTRITLKLYGTATPAFTAGLSRPRFNHTLKFTVISAKQVSQ